ncbi:hypothetical protein PDE_09463 [Penicillium oxalicum 114-2]|uniref:Uncharacterized protein n=1 Tax=Penicillium oxalicum (strain 114-2 / CGMCC 5302) TaxID=933388 RepID=S7ZVP8_PENO1|nr:hypothetical protein PDE_09463 [Penicillium oxalicum 114-2]
MQNGPRNPQTVDGSSFWPPQRNERRKNDRRNCHCRRSPREESALFFPILLDFRPAHSTRPPPILLSPLVFTYNTLYRQPQIPFDPPHIPLSILSSDRSITPTFASSNFLLLDPRFRPCSTTSLGCNTYNPRHIIRILRLFSTPRLFF